MASAKQMIVQLIVQSLEKVKKEHPLESLASLEACEKLLTRPQNREFGDWAMPCFFAAKALKKSPADIAKAWLTKINEYLQHNSNTFAAIEQVTAMGPYINFKENYAFASSNLINSIVKAGICYAAKSVDADSPKVVLESSSPNIAKPLSIGHLRGTNIGACLGRILQHQGFKVERINHLGDWGTQFGKVMLAFDMMGNEEALQKEPIEHLYQLYVEFHKMAQKDESLDQKARDKFSLLEQGDAETKALWQKFKDISIEFLQKIYNRIGVEFDYYWGESHYLHCIDDLIANLKDKNLLQSSQEAQIVDLKEYDLGVSVVQKKDDSSLYITRDLAAAIYRYKHFNFEKMVYVVGTPQSLHFKQLFKILELLGYNFVEKCEHVAFGHVAFPGQTMSTRKGNIVLLEDVLNEAKSKALQVMQSKNPDLDNIEDTAEAVGMGAILFADLSNRRTRDAKFIWDDILNFDGETGPYIQYALVRCKSLLKKADVSKQERLESKDYNPQTQEEKDLLQVLGSYQEALDQTWTEYEPFHLAQYTLKLVKAFSKVYSKCPILKDEGQSKTNKLALVQASSIVLQSCLELLGVPVLEKM